MFVQQRAAILLGALLLLPLTGFAQQSDAKLQPTSANESARNAMHSAIFESQNLRAAEARKLVASAIAADPQLGIARVYQAVIATGMTPAAREAAIAQHLGAMGSASPAEVLLALYWREAAAGRGAAAVPILKSAMELIPGDADIAYIYSNTQQAGKTPQQQAAIIRAHLQRFPEHAAAYNQLAYTLWRTGEKDAALAAVQQYAKYAPMHPNAHDSYADILLLLGRGEEAIPHVKREIELDPDFAGAHNKLGSIYLTMGNVAEARSNFATGASKAVTAGDRIEAAYWQAATQVYDRNAAGAQQEIARAAGIAKSENLSGALALAHDRAAVVEAYLGNKNKVGQHLAAAEAAASNANQTATYRTHAVIALSRIGRAQEARAALAQLRATNPDPNGASPLDAILALDAKDYAAAETAIAKLSDADLLTRALRAELMLRTNRKAEGEALRREVLAGSVKLDGNPPINFFSLIGRMRVQKV
jgi:Flp pilus assembly protein TadD